jgi:hypothetical protein
MRTFRAAWVAIGFSVILGEISPGQTPPARRSAARVIATSNPARPSLDQNADYICDGVRDEAEIQLAINDLAATGGRITLREGEYNICSTIIGNSDIILEGCAVGMWGTRGTQLNVNPIGCEDQQALPLAPFIALSFTDKNSIQINNIRFQGNGSAQSEQTISFVRCHNVHIKDCEFVECSPAIYAERPWDFWTTETNFLDCGFGNSPSQSAVICHPGSAPYTGSGWKFRGCRWEKRPGTSFYSDPGGWNWNDNISFVQCKFEGDETNGNQYAIYGRFLRLQVVSCDFYGSSTNTNLIYLSEGTRGTIISNNNFLNHTNYAVWISPTVDRTSIMGNQFMILAGGTNPPAQIRIAGTALLGQSLLSRIVGNCQVREGAGVPGPMVSDADPVGNQTVSSLNE